MTEQERDIQIALGTLKEYAVQFIFGSPPQYLVYIPKIIDIGRYTFWKNCVYATIVFAVDEKDALNIAREEAFQKKKWQKGFTDYRADCAPWRVDSLKKELKKELKIE